MQRAVPFASVLVLASIAGCMSAVETRSASTTDLDLGQEPSSAASASSEAPPCVMEVPGTGISMRNIDGGLAVVFDTVTPSAVGTLRRAVRALEESYGQEHVAHAEGHDHSPRAHEIARRFRSMNGELPAHSTQVTDVPRGARLEVRAEDGTDVSVLRRKMRAEIATMQRGVCPLVY